MIRFCSIIGFCALAIAAPLAAASAREKVLYSFKGAKDGLYPYAGLIADAAGNLYGTTTEGGTSGSGTVFKLAPDGTETVLYRFKGGTDGLSPYSGLLADGAGNLYGTTEYGGVGNCSGNFSGCGTVFRLAPNGKEIVLHGFNGNDGAYPLAVLIADAAGNLYGTTWQSGRFGGGTAFKLTPNGKLKVLHNFAGRWDGTYPQAGMIADNAGNLYGTTAGGPNHGCGCGTVFSLAPDNTMTVLHSFKDNADGRFPTAGLIADNAGNLYGTTEFTAFKLAPDGTETVLHFFDGKMDGSHPSGLIADIAGNLYGTAWYGGDGNCPATVGCGKVFKLAPDGKETVLYSFKGGTDGAYPAAGLIADNAGNLYGTTTYGGRGNCSNSGVNGCGTIFEIEGAGAIPRARK